MPRTPKESTLTAKEQDFCLYYFKNRRPSIAAIEAGCPVPSAKQNANRMLNLPRVKAYLRKLWGAADSPIVMSVRERKEKLSLMARGVVGDTFTGEGNIDWDAVKTMDAVKEVNIEETTVGIKHPRTIRTIKVKLHNPVESIHELNLMEKLYRTNEAAVNINPVYNYYVTDKKVIDDLGKIGDRTQKQIALTGTKAEQDEKTGE